MVYFPTTNGGIYQLPMFVFSATKSAFNHLLWLYKVLPIFPATNILYFQQSNIIFTHSKQCCCVHQAMLIFSANQLAVVMTSKDYNNLSYLCQVGQQPWVETSTLHPDPHYPSRTGPSRQSHHLHTPEFCSMGYFGIRITCNIRLTTYRQ